MDAHDTEPDHAAGDLVVVGGSAGGIEPLQQMVARLPEDLAAPVLVTVHVSTTAQGALASMLERATSLPTAYAEDGKPLEPGRIAVAPPGHHLTVEADRMRVLRGPRQNGHRPSIDALFRSAAAAVGPHAVGVLLSGALDDGVAGLATIARGGGRTIVQDPASAAYPSMPSNALQVVTADLVVEPDRLAAAVVDLVGVSMAADAAPSLDNPRRHEPTATPTALTCPECSGVLWEIDEPELVTYRCRVGHRWSPASLADANEQSIESALWAALRLLEERMALCDELAERARNERRTTSATHFDQRARAAERDANNLRAVVEQLDMSGDAEDNAQAS